MATNATVTFNTVNANLTGNVTGNADTASTLETARTISLSGDVSGSVSFDGSQNVDITATIQPNSVTLGSDTTGDYVKNLVAGTGITIINNSGEGATPSISVTENTYQPLDAELTAIAGLTSAADKLPYFTGSGTASTADITAAARSILDDSSTSDIRTTLGVGTSDSPSFAGVTADNIQIGITGANEIDTSSGNLTIDSAGGTTTVDDDLVVSGNLTVNGTTTTLNTETLAVEDNIITLNSNVSSSPSTNAGIEVERGTSDNVFVRWNETSDKWELTNDGTTYGNIVTTGDTATVTNTMLAGSIDNAKLTNSFITVNGSNISLGNSVTLYAGTTSLQTSSASQALTGISSVTLPGSSSGSIHLTPASVAGTGTTITLPATTGTVITDGDTATVTNTMLAGSIANNKLSNSAITINSASTSLGGSVTLYAGTTTLQTSSANQALTGISSVTLPGSTSGSVQIIPASTAGSGTILTLPATTGTVVTTGDTGTVTSTMIADGAITNSDINASAAIALSKLASGSSGQIVLANSSGVPTYTTVSGDITISDTGVVSISENSVVLGTDTTGDYVSSLVAGAGITLSNNSGEGATPTVGLTNSSITIGSQSISLGGSSTTLSGITDISVIGGVQTNSSFEHSYTDKGTTYTGFANVSPDVIQFYTSRSSGNTADISMNPDNGYSLSFTTSSMIRSVSNSGAQVYTASTTLPWALSVDRESGNSNPIQVWRQNGTVLASVGSTGEISASSLYLTSGSVIFEGSTANDFETTLQVADPTADRTITLPDASGTVALSGAIQLGTDTNGNYVQEVFAGTGVTITGGTGAEGTTPTFSIGQAVGTSDNVQFNTVRINKIYSQNVGSGETDIRFRNPTSDNTIYVPDTDGNFAIVSSSTGITELGTDTTGDYVKSLVAGTGISLTNNSGEGATPNIALNAALNDLTDVELSTPSNNNVLKYNSSTSNWENSSSLNLSSLTVSDLTVTGTETIVSATNLSITDSLIYLSAEQFNTDVVDIGIFGAYGDANPGHYHTGLVRDATDGKWKLFSGAGEPTDNVVNFTSVTYDALKIGNLEASTITSGTWNGSLISGQYGGTGVANTGKTITLGGNLETSGSYNLTLTQTGTTNVTLPTTGTLATLAGAESLTNKKLGSLTSDGIVTTSNGDGTLSVTSTTGTGSVVLAGSPALTGVPTAPTAAADTNTTQIATTAFVITQAGTTTPSYISSGQYATVGSSLKYAREDHTHGYNGLGLTSGTLAQFSATTSSQLAGVISDETGSGSLVFATSPTLVTPNIGVATGTSFNSITGLSSTNPSALGSVAVGTSTTTARADHVHPTTGLGLTSGTLAQFAATTSSQLAGVISDETGSGSLVFGTSPAITTSLTTPSTTFSLVDTTATTVNFAGAATTLSIGAATGTTTINNGLVVTGNLTVNGTTTTVNSTVVSVDDINIVLGDTASPTDVTANGGGITLKGTTDKTFNWTSATSSWTSSEDLNLVSGKVFEINGTSVLSATTLGSGVVNSSLTSVGTISAGVWQGSTISSTYLPSASTSAAGVVQLNNTNTSNSTSQAATANALRELQYKFLMEVI